MREISSSRSTTREADLCTNGESLAQSVGASWFRYASLTRRYSTGQGDREIRRLCVDAHGHADVRLFPCHRPERARLDRTGLAALEAPCLVCTNLHDLDVCHAFKCEQVHRHSVQNTPLDCGRPFFRQTTGRSSAW